MCRWRPPSAFNLHTFMSKVSSESGGGFAILKIIARRSRSLKRGVADALIAAKVHTLRGSHWALLCTLAKRGSFLLLDVFLFSGGMANGDK